MIPNQLYLLSFSVFLHETHKNKSSYHLILRCFPKSLFIDHTLVKCSRKQESGHENLKSKQRARNLGHYLRSVPQLTPINTTKCTFSELVIVIKIVCSSMQFLQRKYPPCWLLLSLFFPACLSTHKLAKAAKPARGQWDWSSRSVGPYTNSSKQQNKNLPSSYPFQFITYSHRAGKFNAGLKINDQKCFKVGLFMG